MSSKTRGPASPLDLVLLRESLLQQPWGSNNTSILACHQSPKAQEVAELGTAMGRLQGEQKQRREAAVQVSRFLTPSTPEKLEVQPYHSGPLVCEAALSPLHLSLHLGHFFPFFGKSASSPHPPVSYRVCGCFKKNISQKRKSDSRG